MRVQITGWRAKNLRGYLRDVDIDFSSHPKRWTLLQMPNGTGKTTTMRLFRDALTGKSLTATDINSLKVDDSVESGFFELALRIDDDPWRVRMDFDFRNGRCTFTTTSVSDVSGGDKPGHRLPPLLRDTFEDKITQLFVFDGELASEIIEQGADRADSSIRALYKLDQLRELELEIDALAKKRQRSAASISSAATKNSIERFTNELEEVLNTLAQLERDERSLKSEKKKSEREVGELDQRIDELTGQNTQYADELKEIEDEILRSSNLISELTAQSIQLFRSPPLLHETVFHRLESLGGTMQTLKLPRTMSEEFFLQLAEQPKCVCGSTIGQEERQTILSTAKDYLGNDQIAVINQMKLALREVNQERTSLGEVLGQLGMARDALQLASQRKLRIEADPNAPRFEEIEKCKAERARILSRLATVDESIEKLTADYLGSTDTAWQSNIPACKRERHARQRKLDTVSGTYDFMQKTEALKALVKSTELGAVKRLRTRIKDKTNKNLENILPNEQLRVSSIEGSLCLTTDSVQVKTSVSEGQKLAVSYAFLTALLAQAPHKLPFVVDSPAVSLDIEIRRTVGELIPPLFDQMIIFVISSEREGFSDTFFERDDVEYITISIDGITGRPKVENGIDAFQKFHATVGAKG
ncbi:AAA family ATPase [Sulfitobacter sp. HNIBRBA2951]|uniref:AAA family ATPase n=1 Tax=Sulfitobacter aquimarinus TaxID=3158557 RepID=UPI0032DF8902